jgi:hypothetical protein
MVVDPHEAYSVDKTSNCQLAPRFLFMQLIWSLALSCHVFSFEQGDIRSVRLHGVASPEASLESRSLGEHTKRT